MPFKFVFAILIFAALSVANAEDTTASSPAPAATAPGVSVPTPASTAKTAATADTSANETATCVETVNSVVRSDHRTRLKPFCDRVSRLPSCTSFENRPIQHVDFESSDKRAKRILVIGMIHGDEPLAGEMALDWSQRLENLRKQKIEPRNNWRVVPLLNPDGFQRKTRMNARGVDLNRNFPTKDWSEEADKFWKTKAAADPRRFPGDGAASEPETKCVISHIKDFKPDFIVSVHTPYKVLDFDGPHMSFPRYKDLPWRALGNFPGSLGRYMWKDYQVPVLTVELGQSMIDSGQLQDIVGTFAIEAARRSGTKTASLFDLL
jgi:protein MpaA